MHIVSVPITKALGTQLEDIVGELRIDEQLADQIAAMSAKQVEMRIATSIEWQDGQPKLRLVSIACIPVEAVVAEPPGYSPRSPREHVK